MAAMAMTVKLMMTTTAIVVYFGVVVLDGVIAEVVSDSAQVAMFGAELGTLDNPVVLIF